MDCSLYHNSCTVGLIMKTLKSLKYALRMYILTNMVPVLLFKYKNLKEKKLELLWSTTIKILRSTLFFVGYNFNERLAQCLFSRIAFFNKNTFNINTLRIVLSTMISCTAVLFDFQERIILYTHFLVPRVSEGSWDMLEKLGYVKSVYNGEKFIFAILIGIMTVLMKHYKDSVSSGYQYLYHAVFGLKND